MQAGKLKHYVTFHELPADPVKNEFGEEMQHEVLVHKAWASIEPMTGSEYFSAATVNADITHRIAIRYVPGIKPEQTILCGTRKFNVLSAVDVEEQTPGT